MDIGPVSISPSNATIRTAEEFLNLSCSADIILDSLSQDVTFEWFFGPNNSTLPTGVTVSNVTNNSNTYTSTLQLSSLTQSHVGTYTCRIGGNKRLAASATVTVSVNKSEVSTTVTHSSGSVSTTVTVSVNKSEISTTVTHSSGSVTSAPDAVTQSLATSASDTIGNSDPHYVSSNPSSNVAVTVTIVVVILIIIAAIITVVVITAIVYR